ncbi:hypothetical protein Goari_020990, partial [Gossypium aridum]|nr:hypothetical protein [Gossypium aridum]
MIVINNFKDQRLFQKNVVEFYISFEVSTEIREESRELKRAIEAGGVRIILGEKCSSIIFWCDF